MLDGAAKWTVMNETNKDSNGNKLDRRRSYKEKICYENILDRLKTYLGIDDFKIKEVIDLSFGMAKLIDFSVCGQDWELAIPIIKNVTLKHYEAYGSRCFKLRLLHCKGNVLKEVGPRMRKMG